ncbi:hypothetical protein FJTKL_09863 [Diaporthe vaccinii]|uniref:Uncharacterized protein n=1 Tax=Diaporthe vaccinii TaxID=105482 RepID=A0ABR4EM95_9PEZI
MLERQPLGPHQKPLQASPVLFGCAMHTAFPSSITLERRLPSFETVADNMTYYFPSIFAARGHLVVVASCRRDRALRTV